jgi:hypothetical protein
MASRQAPCGLVRCGILGHTCGDEHLIIQSSLDLEAAETSKMLKESGFYYADNQIFSFDKRQLQTLTSD